MDIPVLIICVGVVDIPVLTICVGAVAIPVSVFHIIMNNGVTSTVWWLPECETHTHVRKTCNRLSDKGDFLCFCDLSAPYSSSLLSLNDVNMGVKSQLDSVSQIKTLRFYHC